MLKDKKSVFLIHDKKIAQRFNELLSENLRIETELGNSGPDKVIFVSSENYQRALEEGLIISNLNNWNISWVNAYNEKRPREYISVMYCILPKTRKASSSWEVLEAPNLCPIDIKEYIERLQAFLNGRPIKIKYNGVDNAIEFLVKGSLEDYELVKQQCEGFNYVTKISPFIKTEFLEKDGTLIKTEEEKVKEESNLKSYFNESMFVDGLLRPEGSNIAPKTDTEQDLTTGYKYSSSRLGTREFDISSVDVYDLEEIIQGTFINFEEKEYNYYWNNEKEEHTYCKSVMPFTMLDNGSFESKVDIGGEEITVSTKVNVVRNVVGVNFDGKSVRDGLFPELAHEDCRGTFELNEYYKTISNRTRLLHYSNSSDFFEVYELPSGWIVGDGVSKLKSPKVFDDLDFDKNDKDLEEINEILASRKDKAVVVLSKTIDYSN